MHKMLHYGAALLPLVSCIIQTSPACAQGTAFTYQGRLNGGGAVANGSYDLQFTLYATNVAGTAVAGPVTNTAVAVTNGLFTTTVDFGSVFTGTGNWLAIAVSTNAANAYITLAPRQQVTPAPYAIFANTASNLSGTVSAAQINSVIPSSLLPNFQASANYATIGGGIQNTSRAAYSVVGGGTLNTASGGDATVGGGNVNTASGTDSTVSGGYNNTAGNFSTVGGGYQNNARGMTFGDATVSGGTGNNATNDFSTVGGGQYNLAGGPYATVPGGSANHAMGKYSLAAGQQAQATNQGAFVWADSQNATFASTNNDSFNIRAAGGLRLVTGGSGMVMDGQPVFAGLNGGSLTNLNAAQLTGLSFAASPVGGAPILNMIWIVPGTFIMGSPSSETDRNSDETQHTVTLTNGFWIGQHPVTQGEYLAVVGSNPSSFTGDLTRPVDSVSWFNATNYCCLLTQQEQRTGRLPTGWVYRLPTESEWEYCCRALTTTRFYFGNDPGNGNSLTNYAWYSVNSGSSTQPVGQLLPNSWGLVDMVGNVFEWCQDWYGTYPTANVSYNPQGAASSTGRVLRGCDWNYPASQCRSASRGYTNPTGALNDRGFRVVLSPGQ
jgi:formylglycine-generating enzyme required for sulfatase activity